MDIKESGETLDGLPVEFWHKNQAEKLTDIQQIIENTPNDQELGDKIRQYGLIYLGVNKLKRDKKRA